LINFLYTLIIFPIEQIMELSYVFVSLIFRNPAFSIFGISFMVSILTLPLYLMAEKQQRIEREIQKRMKPKIDTIKAVFNGDERFMLLSTYYRQNKYHPLYSLRSSVSLLIQIPFFIAAYHFLSNLEQIKGISFGPIKNLAMPDSLLSISNFSINLLPIAMTIINCAAALIYSKGLSAKEKIQLYGMAAVFLLLLYNSPSGMVLYWTGNNVFSLIKNTIEKTKQPKQVTLSVVSVSCFLFSIYLLYSTDFWSKKHIAFFILIALVFLLSSILFILSRKKISLLSPLPNNNNEEQANTAVLFILSQAVLFLLAGLVIPSLLITSSVQEFSFIENFKTPFPFIAITILQSVGIFLLWPLCIYFMFSKSIQRIITYISATLSCVAMVNAFIFSGRYGPLTIFFTFSDNIVPNRLNVFFNLLIIVVTVITVMFLVNRFRKIFTSVITILFFALILTSAINIIKIYTEFKTYQLELSSNNTLTDKPVYHLSKNGRNVLIMMIDKAISGYVPYIFEEKPELLNSYDGFTWYKNTISFGGYTVYATPGIYGGYEYTPLEMQARDNTPLVEKHNEALLLLPHIFLDNGFDVTVTDPPYANYKKTPDLSIFSGYPQIHVENVSEKYSEKWLSERDDEIQLVNLTGYIELVFIRFSFFKLSPLALRNYVYDGGKWKAVNAGKYLYFSKETLKHYAALDVLPDITKINDNNIDTYNTLVNQLTHEPWFLQPPDYVPADKVTNKGNSPFADNQDYHVNMAALLLIGKWLDFLKENDVYDNTRVIIVSDHGSNEHTKFPDNIVLPNGNSLKSYTALLLEKDFNAHGGLSVNETFMTNADVPLMALKDIVENPVNPWTGKILSSDKDNGITLTTMPLADINRQHKYRFAIKPDEWLHIHTNIYEPENWSHVRH